MIGAARKFGIINSLNNVLKNVRIADNSEATDKNREFYEKEHQKATTVAEFQGIVNKNRAVVESGRGIAIHHLSRTLLEALLFPELTSGIKLPSAFQIPSYPFQQVQSFTVETNAGGNLFVQVNLGQFLTSNNFRLDNGGTGIGCSNLFICAGEGASGLNGNTVISEANNVMVPSNLLQYQSDIFTSIRPGPMSVRYEYIGRLDTVSGNVTMGVAYTTKNDPNFTANSVNPVRSCNGLMPDNSYSTLSILEDAPFSVTASPMTPLKGVYIPHDYSCLNFRPPSDAAGPLVGQRLYLLMLGGPKRETVGRITITANWEGIPAAGYTDLIRPSYSDYPSDFNHNELYQHIIQNGYVVTRDNDASIAINLV
jgi:hypothetical protein